MGACSEDLAFGAVTLDETGKASLEAAVEDAYLGIFDFLDKTGFTAPIRFWNYLTSITDDDRGLERYRRFNIGRHQAFSARLRQPVPPAASGVGGHQGASVIYFLAAREPAKAVENPRQVSAYAYPPIYGPRSPSFSRASIHALGPTETLFVSGTASIVGHETRHRGDLAGQIAETTENLRTLIGAAEQTASAPLGDHWALKVYLHDPAYREAVNPAINAMFGADCQRLYLRGDMCRSDLLVEIEAFRHFDLGAAHPRIHDPSKAS
jgi:enamine deaminase RidA (YjgF/YER057c/UK114 family)